MLTLLLQNATMQNNTWPNFINILDSRYELKDEWCIPSWFTTIQEKHIFVQKLAMDKFLLTSHFCYSLPAFCPTQGHPAEALAFTQTFALLIGLRRGSTKVPCICVPLHALVSIAWTSFYSSSTLIINPL
jgi:hypothetical protein